MYNRIAETTFKLRYANHGKSFSHQNTELAKLMLENEWFKEKCTRRLVHFGKTPFNAAAELCHWCLKKKIRIALHKGNIMLKKRTEVLSKCRQMWAKNKSLWCKKFNGIDWGLLQGQQKTYCCRANIKLKVPNQVVFLFENP